MSGERTPFSDNEEWLRSTMFTPKVVSGALLLSTRAGSLRRFEGVESKALFQVIYTIYIKG